MTVKTQRQRAHFPAQIDLDLELPIDLRHARHDHAIDPDKTADVIPFAVPPSVVSHE